jgi:hypothetical protein
MSIKIEDFISKEELDKMSEKEREIFQNVFELKKETLQSYVDVLGKIEEIKNKI